MDGVSVIRGAPTVDKPALRYHGAKFRLAPWVLKHFPAHGTYVDGPRRSG